MVSLVFLCISTLASSAGGAPWALSVVKADSKKPVNSELAASVCSILDSNLLFSVTKALIISFDTFIASMAISTKYIRPIIFCLGVSLPPPMVDNF